MKNKYSLLTIAILILTVWGCSTVRKEVKQNSGKNRPRMNELAMKFFIRGNTQELKGNLKQAILNYKQALKYDTTAGIYYSLGKAYLKSNKLLQALEQAKAALRMDSANVEYLHLLGNVYSLSHNIDSAEIIFNKIIKMDSTDTRAYYNLGVLNQFSHPHKALKIFNKLLKITGPNWDVLLKIAEINDALGNVKETIKTVEQLRQMNPADFGLQKLLIESYMKAGNYKKALNLIDDALLTHPKDVDILRERGEIFLAQKKYAMAEKEYLKIMSSKSVPFKTKFRIASSFAQAGEKNPSLMDIGKKLLTRIEKDSSDWRVEAMLGEISISEKDDSTAEIFLRKAVNNASWNSQLWSRYANLLFMNSKYSELIKEVKPHLSDFPDNFFLNLITGLSYAQLGKHKDAKKYLLKAVDLNANDVTALSALGFTLNQLKENDDAIFYLERALKIQPKNVQVLGILGMIYDNKKEYDKCDEVYTRALKIDSTNALILNNYAYSLSERGIKLNTALRMIKKALKKEPSNASYLDTYGWILYKLNRFEDAKKWIDESLKKDSGNDTVLEHMGDVWLKLGDKERAVKFWKKALKLKGEDKNLLGKIKEYSQ